MLISDLKVIGENLYKIRKQIGLSQEETAWRAGISSRTYADIERGETNARLETIIKICNVLHVTPDVILTESNADSSDEANLTIVKDTLFAQLDMISPKEQDTALRLLQVYLQSCLQ